MSEIEKIQRYIERLLCSEEGGAGMSNNERFNAILNSCQNPQAVKAALLVLADAGFFQKGRKEAGVA